MASAVLRASVPLRVDRGASDAHPSGGRARLLIGGPLEETDSLGSARGVHRTDTLSTGRGVHDQHTLGAPVPVEGCSLGECSAAGFPRIV